MSGSSDQHSPTALSIARRALADGNLLRAELFCHEALKRDPKSDSAWNVLGAVAVSLGCIENAREAFNTALKINRNAVLAANNLAKIQGLDISPKWSVENPGYLVIRPWNTGFWSDIFHVVGQLLVAEISGRTPIVHWDRSSRYWRAGHENAFDCYFHPVSDKTIRDILHRSDLSYTPSKWSSENLQDENQDRTYAEWKQVNALLTFRRQENVLVSEYNTPASIIARWLPPSHPWRGMPLDELMRAIFEKYLKPRSDIEASVSETYEAHFSGHKVLAVHARGSDKFIEFQDAAAANDEVFASVRRRASITNPSRIFLLTDSAPLLARFNSEYGERLLTLNTIKTDGALGLHFMGHDGYQLGREIMIDTYLAARCDWFVGNGQSNVAATVEHLRAWSPGSFELVRPNVHYDLTYAPQLEI